MQNHVLEQELSQGYPISVLGVSFYNMLGTRMNLIKDKRQILAQYPTCYACNSKSTSMEHAPPRCFFPEDRDEDGNMVMRNELIKVPSCDRHNSEKSNDDVYALWHLAALDGTNEVADSIRRNWLQRAADHDWSKRGGAFMKRLLSEIHTVDDLGRPVGNADHERMVRFHKHCARALYFYENLKHLELPLRVTNISNDFRDPAKTQELRSREVFFESQMEDASVLGANPEVFNYSIHHREDEGVILIRTIYYGCLKHWTFHHPIFPLRSSSHASIPRISSGAGTSSRRWMCS